jgi:hypothetical protein
MRVGIAALVLGCLLWVSPSQAALMHVIGGSHDLLPNTAGQAIEVLVEGDGNVQGMVFVIGIGNGITADVPNITALDIAGPGTLFGTKANNGQGGTSGLGFGFGGVWYADVTTVEPLTVTPDPDPMVLAKATIDTTGFFSGVFPLALMQVDLGDLGVYDTNFAGWELVAGNTLQIDGGRLNIVPEPSSFLLMFAGVAGLGIVAVARRKQSA